MADFFITLAVLFLLGLTVHWLGIKTQLPRVSLLILVGIGIGPSGLDLFADHREQWFPVISDIAMVMIGFLLGGSMTLPVFRKHGKSIMVLSLGVTLGTFAIVFLGLFSLGQGVAVAILLAALATATDPAATTAVLMENGSQHSSFGQTLLGIVAIDDAWGLLIFSFCMVIAVDANTANGMSVLLGSLYKLGGAVMLGIGIGLPMAFLTGRIRQGEPVLVEALGLVFLCAGLALTFNVSHLLAAIIMGATVANLAKHHTRPFHAIEGIEWPFLVLFFILAGASLKMTALLLGGIVGIAYIVLRVVGKIIGGYLSSFFINDSRSLGGWIGLALLPQAGVAVAMALLASQALPQHGELILTVAISSTVFFELLGPIATRLALQKFSS